MNKLFLRSAMLMRNRAVMNNTQRLLPMIAMNHQRSFAAVSRDDAMKRMVGLIESMERAKTDGIEITESTNLNADLGLDSLDSVEFGLAIEDEFDIEIEDEEAETIKTVGDAVDIIVSKAE